MCKFGYKINHFNFIGGAQLSHKVISYNILHKNVKSSNRFNIFESIIVATKQVIKLSVVPTQKNYSRTFRFWRSHSKYRHILIAPQNQTKLHLSHSHFNSLSKNKQNLASYMNEFRYLSIQSFVPFCTTRNPQKQIMNPKAVMFNFL